MYGAVTWLLTSHVTKNKTEPGIWCSDRSPHVTAHRSSILNLEFTIGIKETLPQQLNPQLNYIRGVEC